MIKKILFFGIAIILGFMVLMMSYSGFQMSDVQAKITEYMNNHDYVNLSRCFLPYFNASSIKELNEEGNVKVTVLESIHAVKTTIKVDENEQEANRYVASYTFYLEDFKDFDFNGVDTNGTVSNYARVEFYNGDKSLVYYFNDPITASSANADGVNRYYTDYAANLDFIEIDLPISDIEEKLDGSITSLRVYDSKAADSTATPKLEISFDALNIETDFFTLANELVDNWNTYLDDLDADKFNNFFDPAEGEGWIDRFDANENYRKGINGYDELIGNSAIIKTVIVMVVYLAVCVGLGFLLLRKKNAMPKPYLRDQYKKQMVSANAIKAEVKEVEKTTLNNNDEKTETSIVEESQNESNKVEVIETSTTEENQDEPNNVQDDLSEVNEDVKTTSEEKGEDSVKTE